MDIILENFCLVYTANTTRIKRESFKRTAKNDSSIRLLSVLFIHSYYYMCLAIVDRFHEKFYNNLLHFFTIEIKTFWVWVKSSKKEDERKNQEIDKRERERRHRELESSLKKY